MIAPLLPPFPENCRPHMRRVLQFDPAEIYERITVDHYKRRNELGIGSIFPTPDDGTCSCGCGQKLTGRRTRWATDECSRIPVIITLIINGDPQVVRRYLQEYYHDSWACFQCGKTEDFRQFSNGLLVSDLEVDHIVPVHLGGGGCWLSNYQILCHHCHKEKSIAERKSQAYDRTRGLLRERSSNENGAQIALDF